MSENQYDTCVIGAGPAGLAVARALAERDASALGRSPVFFR
ncbi:hypothetical protein [Streptomyces sp. NPDC001250]